MLQNSGRCEFLHPSKFESLLHVFQRISRSYPIGKLFVLSYASIYSRVREGDVFATPNFLKHKWKRQRLNIRSSGDVTETVKYNKVSLSCKQKQRSDLQKVGPLCRMGESQIHFDSSTQFQYTRKEFTVLGELTLETFW